MSKRNLDWTKEKYERFIKDGRGKGELSDYKPWLNVQTTPSLGKVSRLYSWKTGRIHELLSDIQTRYFYLLEWESNVTDIREHWPLLDIDEVLTNSIDLDIDKYSALAREVPYILTTTFLISQKDEKGNERYIARNIKASSELEKKSTIERLEIIRRYFEKRNIDFGIVTQKEIPIAKCKNIEWIRTCHDIGEINGISIGEKDYLCRTLLDLIKNNMAKPIRKITADFDMEQNMESGMGLLVFKHLLARRIIQVDMDKKIDINRTPLILIQSIDIF